MDIIDPSIDLKEVELRDVDKKTPPEKKTTNQERLIVDVKITFCTHVGLDGVLILLFSLMIAGLFVFIAFMYTKGFQAWRRPGVWAFMVFAVLYSLLVIKCLWTWKKMATAFTEQQQAEKAENQGRLTRSKSAIERAKRAASNAKNVYEKLQVNGQWFLWKLYVSELFESANQCLNLTTVYLCSLPVPFTASMCLLLALDCFHTGWTITHKNTPARRDRQIKVDAMVDFLCVVLPLTLIYFGYQIPISISEMLQIMLLPTFFMLAKLDDIFEEGIHHRSAHQVLKEQAKQSFKIKRRRESLFQQVAHLEMAKKTGRKSAATSTDSCCYL
jgi:Ca2+/Na+ antiporter